MSCIIFVFFCVVSTDIDNFTFHGFLISNWNFCVLFRGFGLSSLKRHWKKIVKFNIPVKAEVLYSTACLKQCILYLKYCYFCWELYSWLFKWRTGSILHFSVWTVWILFCIPSSSVIAFKLLCLEIHVSDWRSKTRFWTLYLTELLSLSYLLYIHDFILHVNLC